jgi:hypothetical protein
MRYVIIILSVALSAIGADLSGNWKGQVNRPDGQTETSVNLELKQDGETITGRIGSGHTDTAPIDKAKLDGEKLSFEVVGNSSTFKVSLDVAGDSMKGTVVRSAGDRVSPPMPIELKRDK